MRPSEQYDKLQKGLEDRTKELADSLTSLLTATAENPALFAATLDVMERVRFALIASTDMRTFIEDSLIVAAEKLDTAEAVADLMVSSKPRTP